MDCVLGYCKILLHYVFCFYASRIYAGYALHLFIWIPPLIISDRLQMKRHRANLCEWELENDPRSAVRSSWWMSWGVAECWGLRVLMAPDRSVAQYQWQEGSREMTLSIHKQTASLQRPREGQRDRCPSGAQGHQTPLPLLTTDPFTVGYKNINVYINISQTCSKSKSNTEKIRNRPDC